MSYIAAKRTFYWRCSRDSCRARYHGALHPDEYKRGWKCKQCGCAKFCIIRDIRKHSGHVDCTCNGVMSWAAPHRRGSQGCWYNRDGTLRDMPPRKHEDRLHPWTVRRIADHDKYGPVFWFYDGEFEYEATWLGSPDSCIAQLGGVQTLLELSAASTERRQSDFASIVARGLDGSADSCNAELGELRANQGNLRRSRKAHMAHRNRAYR